MVSINGDEGSSRSLHLVVFPWLAFGHMLPFLELSKSLARRGHKISFISTPKNISRLPKIPSSISHLIEFVPFTLPPTEGLRPGAEATRDLPQDEIPYLKKALDGLRSPFQDFLLNHPKPVDWIIQDFVQYWIPEMGVPSVFYLCNAAVVLVVLGPSSALSTRMTPEALSQPPPWVPFPTKATFRLYEAHSVFAAATLPNPSGVLDIVRYRILIDGCRSVALRTSSELESEYLALLNDLCKKPVLPVGLQPPKPAERALAISADEEEEEEDESIRWLDGQKPRSVVYVALGTEVMISVELLHELALGLETAGLPFLWALRQPIGMDEGVELLPAGFELRVKGYARVVNGWVPQLRILGHESVVGFLTHCGWSSAVEGMQAGLPLVMLPVFFDQGLNARLMEEKGMGVEIHRNEEDGNFTREDVARALRLVMVEEEGEKYRRKAREMKEMMGDEKCHEKYVDDFIQHLYTNGGDA